MTAYDTNYETNRTVPLGSITTLRVVNAFERIVHAYTAWQAARGTRSTLSKLSDQQLADIGLSRGDIFELADQLSHK